MKEEKGRLGQEGRGGAARGWKKCVCGFSEEYARKGGAGGIKVDENLPSELERPINEPAGFMNLLYAK